MSAMNECMTALIFTDLEYAMKTFDVGRQDVIDLISNFQALQSLEFVQKLKFKVVSLKDKLNRMQISEKTGLPLSSINHILSQKLNQNQLLQTGFPLNNKIQNELPRQFTQVIVQLKAPQNKDILDLDEQDILKKFVMNTNQKQEKKLTKKAELSPVKSTIEETNKKKLRDHSSNTLINVSAELGNKKRSKRIKWTDNQIVRITKSGIVIRKNNKESYVCYQCDKSFHDGMTLSRHFLSRHPGKTRIQLFCPLCQNEQFDNTQKYTSHLKRHREEGQQVSFTKKAIETHAKRTQRQVDVQDEIQTEQITKKYHKQCINMVEKSPNSYFEFMQGKEHKETLRCDRITHLGIESDDQINIKTTKPSQIKEKFNCDKCNKKFDQQNKLIIHKKQKHKTKISESYIVTNKKLDQLEKEHLFVNFGQIIFKKNNEAIFKCKECEQEFEDNLQLTSHFKYQHKDATQNAIICSICTQIFTKRQYLVRHLPYHAIDRKKQYRKAQISSDIQQFQSKSQIEQGSNHHKNQNNSQQIIIKKQDLSKSKQLSEKELEQTLDQNEEAIDKKQILEIPEEDIMIERKEKKEKREKREKKEKKIHEIQDYDISPGIEKLESPQQSEDNKSDVQSQKSNTSQEISIHHKQNLIQNQLIEKTIQVKQSSEESSNQIYKQKEKGFNAKIIRKIQVEDNQDESSSEELVHKNLQNQSSTQNRYNCSESDQDYNTMKIELQEPLKKEQNSKDKSSQKDKNYLEASKIIENMDLESVSEEGENKSLKFIIKNQHNNIHIESVEKIEQKVIEKTNRKKQSKDN